MKKLGGITTTDNVQDLGKQIAIIAVHTRAPIVGGTLDSLYKGFVV